MPAQRMKKDVSEEPSARKPRFFEQVRELLRAKYYSIRTEEVYLGWIRRFILFHGKRHPKEMGGREVARFDALAASLVAATPSRRSFVSRVLGAVLAILLAITYDAQRDGTWARLKICHHDACRWAFFDESRSRTATWCAMGICGNRTKVAAYRRRQAAK